MGTLDEGLALTILRNFQLAKLDVETQWRENLQAQLAAPPTWRWAPGTFVFPEGLCCYCGGVMRSPAIWRAEGLQYWGSWKLAGEGADGYFAFDDSHPHVNNGSICMGGDYQATSVADALFLAFNPLSTYFHGRTMDETVEGHIKAWFADRFGHVCGQANLQTIAGIDNRHLIAAEPGCYCQHCRMHRGEILCPREGCGEWYNPRNGHGTVRCKVCRRITGRDIPYCVEHKHEWRTCVDCDEGQDLIDQRTGERIAEDMIFVEQCPACQKYVCRYCLVETQDHASSCGGDMVDGSGEDEEEEHTCCDCDVCCDCGQEREDF